MAEPQRYTLEEAKRLLDRQECAQFGHDFNVIVIATSCGAPVHISCNRCYEAWGVVPWREDA